MESEMGCCERIKNGFSKLLVECFGTFVFTLLFISGSNLAMLIGLWILTIFCWKISASQLNPAVTLAYMFRSDSKKVHFMMGLLLIGAQCLGAYLGALYMVFILWEIKVMQPDEPSYAFFAMMQETFGTFCFVLFFMIATDEKSHFSTQSAINCFTIACGYVAAREIVSGSTYSFA